MGAKSKRHGRAVQVAPATNSLLSTLLAGVIGLLLTARMLVPTESAEEGRTLWIVQLWLAAGLLWTWNAIRERDHRIRWDRLDVAFWIVVGGHVLSALSVFVTGGQKRAAVNLAWEWVALGACFFLLRQTIRTARDARRIVGLMVAVTVSLAALGLWQHYVYYPETRQEYEQKKSEIQALGESPPTSASDEQYRRATKLRELRAWMFNAGIPQDDTAAAMFEDRLNSSEPFGMFALANTFAGVLLVWLLASTGIVAAAWNGKLHWTRWLPLALATGLIGYCLVLTKSRTAWVGLIAGGALWGGFRLWSSGVKPARWLIYTSAGVCLLIAMLAIAAISGGFDAAVVTEAPKSLSYRLQYWHASWQMLCDRPFFGSGPGNFRQLYVQYKLPTSSEEIADPHNFLFDIWANGGLTGLIGLLVFLFFVARRIRRAGMAESAVSTVHAVEHKLFGPLTVGGLTAFITVFSVTFLSGEGYDLRLLALCSGTLGVIAICGRVSNNVAAGVVCLVAALVCLLTHLLGAGGIEMPAIVQTMLVLVVAITVWREDSAADPRSTAQLPKGALFGGGLFAVLFVICLLSATAPVLNRHAFLSTADAAMVSGQGSAKAIEFYRQAAHADPFSPEPPQRLAQLHYSNWLALPGDRSRDFEKAIGFQQMAIDLNPQSANNYWRLGEWHVEKYRRSANRKSLLAGIAALREAVARYPNHAAIRADLTIALHASGQAVEAAEAANAALLQNSINQREGHRDKFLDSEVIETLQKLRGSAVGGAEQN